MLPSKILSGVLSIVLLLSTPHGLSNDSSKAETKENVKTVYVSKEGNTFRSIAAARDYVRTLDKTNYDRIDIVIKEGIYEITEPVSLTKEDAGSEDCEIRYIGEDGAVLTGGVYLTADRFIPAEGKTTEYFPEEAKDNIVMLDISGYGYGSEYYYKKISQDGLNNDTILPLYKDGALQTVCRYPNEGYVHFVSAERVLVDENAEMKYRYNISAVLEQEVSEHIASWHDISSLFSIGHHTYLWRQNNFKIYSADLETSTITMPYPYSWDTLGYVPISGRPLYFINVPEELDMPGEYYLDENGILYYYKTEDFDTSSFTISKYESAFNIDGADYVTIENLEMIAFSGYAVNVNADNVTIKGCEICGSADAIKMDGYRNLITENVIHDIQFTAIKVQGGDTNTLKRCDTLITENEIYEWGQLYPMYEVAINIHDGVGITVSHNTIHGADHAAVLWDGNYHVIEYNEIYDVCRRSDDCGAIYSYSSYAHYGNIIRYNYIHEVMCIEESLNNLKDYPYCKTSGIYIDGGKSGQTVIYNVLENISGSGVISSGRDETVTNNLFISCGFGVTMSGVYWTGTFVTGSEKSDWSGQGLYGKENNEIWQKAFPELYSYNWTDSDENDPNYFGAPAGNVLKNNYYFYDKANIGSLKWYGHIFTNNIEECVYRFSGENIEDAVEGVNQITYSSKRNPVTAVDVIDDVSAITGITMEDFNLIGKTK